MKNYTGTKTIKAEPMREIDAIFSGFARAIGEDCENRMGYHVVYNNPDGSTYDSWSPKDVFEQSYKISETHIDRMNIEQTELSDKLTKLDTFVNSKNFREIVESDYQASMLYLQYCSMKDYSKALSDRLYGEFSDEGGCNLNFGMALNALLFGCAVRRIGWNGKGLFVVKQIPSHITEEIIPKMQSLPQSAKDIIMSRENKSIDYANQMLIINSEGRADSWVPSVSDIFATDWEIVKEI